MERHSMPYITLDKTKLGEAGVVLDRQVMRHHDGGGRFTWSYSAARDCGGTDQVTRPSIHNVD